MNRFGLDLVESLAGGFDLALRGSLVLAAAWLLTTLLRRHSAAIRHVVWAAALFALIVLPLAQQFLPSWQVLPTWRGSAGIPNSVVDGRSTPIAVAALRRQGPQTAGDEVTSSESLTRPATSPESNRTMITAIATARADSADTPSLPGDGIPATPLAANGKSTIRSALGAIWLVGVLVGCLPVMLGTAHVWRLRRSSQPAPSLIDDEVRSLASNQGVSRHVQVVMSVEREVPMTWGLFAPVLLLPVSATQWSTERRRMVLIHELAHIRRSDCLTQLLGQFARALHWFNPLVWLALRRLRIEQERACDDVVLNCGADANEYASELLSVTARLPRLTWDAAVSLAMGRSSRIEQRLKSILDSDCERRPMSRRHIVATCGLMLIVTCGVAAAQRHVAEAAMPPTRQIALVNQDAEAADSKTETHKAPAAEQGAAKQQPAAPAEAAAGAEDLAKQVLDKIAKLSPTPVDSKALNEAAIRGMLQSLNDPYSSMMSVEQMKELHTQLDGKLVGIGAAMKKEGNVIEVTSVMPNSPAIRGGLKPQDVILEIDGQPAKELAEAVKQIRGQAGTEVTLKILRANKSENLTLKRAEVRLPTVKGLSVDEQGKWRHWLDPDQKIAFLQITQFDQATPNDLKETLTGLQDQGVKGLVLDLRGNVGGLLASCEATARLFLKDGTIAEVRSGKAQESAKFEIPKGHAPLLAETPLIVLIDPTTASAAEVLAAALKHNHRATLLGERTFGKGSVQSILPLGDAGPTLKLTTALIFSPDGQPLQRMADSKSWGVDPHDGYFVPLSTEQRAMWQRMVSARETGLLKLETTVSPEFLERGAADPQLAAALRSLSAKLKTGEFSKTGRPLTELQAELAQRDNLLKQRDELRAKLEQLNRQLGEGR
jgi:carboxyl-terminal processing protease